MTIRWAQYLVKPKHWGWKIKVVKRLPLKRIPANKQLISSQWRGIQGAIDDFQILCHGASWSNIMIRPWRLHRNDVILWIHGCVYIYALFGVRPQKSYLCMEHENVNLIKKQLLYSSYTDIPFGVKFYNYRVVPAGASDASCIDDFYVDWLLFFTKNKKNADSLCSFKNNT